MRPTDNKSEMWKLIFFWYSWCLVY